MLFMYFYFFLLRHKSNARYPLMVMWWMRLGDCVRVCRWRDLTKVKDAVHNILYKSMGVRMMRVNILCGVDTYWWIPTGGRLLHFVRIEFCYYLFLIYIMLPSPSLFGGHRRNPVAFPIGHGRSYKKKYILKVLGGIGFWAHHSSLDFPGLLFFSIRRSMQYRILYIQYVTCVCVYVCVYLSMCSACMYNVWIMYVNSKQCFFLFYFILTTRFWALSSSYENKFRNIVKTYLIHKCMVL